MRNHSARWLAPGLVVFAFTVLAEAATVSTSYAGTDVDLRAALYPDADAFAIGGGLLMNVGHKSWFFNPNLEAAMGDQRDLLLLSGDFHYDFATASSLSIWAGGGPALMWNNPSEGSTTTDFGLNALVGIGGRNAGVRPFGQIRGTFADHSQLALEGGVRF
jgi:hypothetical protein